MAPTTAVSAPGKAFLAGGYLVLDRAHTALVFGLSARINVIARPLPSTTTDAAEIVVSSPQFLDPEWRYEYHEAVEGGGIKVTPVQSASRNPFVETTLTYALTYIHTLHPPALSPLHLTILADNDYYSAPPTTSSTSTPPRPLDTESRFTSFPTTLSSAHKTGLGSSAALVTALTACLLNYFLLPSSPPTPQFSLGSDDGKTKLHNLAQAAHCAAQGKIGSGFDVAAAVYGSCLYRRFSPSLLSSVPEPGSPGFAAKLKSLVQDARWDVEVQPDKAKLPNGVALRMCDVDCGTQSVGMAKSVLAWRARDPENATRVWDELQSRNEALADVLASGNIADIPAAVAKVREMVREMGQASGVPIEPESQTRLLDRLGEVDGVLGGVVPGAGGYDAVALLVKDDEATEGRVKRVLEEWERDGGGRVRLLGVRGGSGGVGVGEIELVE